MPALRRFIGGGNGAGGSAHGGGKSVGGQRAGGIGGVPADLADNRAGAAGAIGQHFRGWVDVGHHLVTRIGQGRPGNGAVPQKAEVIGSVDLAQGEQIGLWRGDDVQLHRGAGLQQRIGAGGDFEILPHFAFL